MNISLKNNPYTIVGILGLIVLALVFLAITPLWIGLIHDSQNLVAVKHETDSLAVQNTQIETFKKAYPEYGPNLEKLGLLFVDRKNPVDFIEFLESAANQTGIVAKISLESGGIEKKETPAMVFTISASSDFLNILRFAERVDNSPYLASVERISLNHQPNLPGNKNYIQGSVDAKLSITALSKP